MPKAELIPLPTQDRDLVVVTDEMLEAGCEEFLEQSSETDPRMIAQAVYLAMEYCRKRQSHERLRFHQYVPKKLHD